MWVILVSESVSAHRDNYIQGLLSNTVKSEEYISDIRTGYSSGRFSTTSNLRNARIFKSKARLESLINKFNNDQNKKDYSNRFNLIKDKHFSIRKLSQSEWDSIIDNKIKLLKSGYERMVSKLEIERRKYR